MSASSQFPVAYSYIRFSSKAQAKGDSLRRQIKDTQSWCQRNGVRLDDSLDLHERGVSAFRGKNATEGKLAEFLKAVQAGTQGQPQGGDQP
jgi:hypothetical protein